MKTFVIIRKTSKRFSIDDFINRENLVSGLLFDGDLFSLEEYLNSRIEEINSNFDKLSINKRINIINDIIKENNSISLEEEGLIIEENIDEQIEKIYSYDIIRNENSEDLFTIIRSDGSIVTESFLYERNNKKMLFTAVRMYKGKDILGFLNLFKENSLDIDEDGTNTITETKKGLLRKEELDKLEQFSFSLGEQIVINTKDEELDINYLLNLHNEMFKDIYEWSGTIRKTEVFFGNKEGINSSKIRQELEKLFGDFEYRFNLLKNEEDVVDFLTDFEYRFVLIHPFLNTNGRMSRLLSYKYLYRLGYEHVPNIYDNRDKRTHYLEAMKEYDKGNREELKKILRNYLNKFKFIGAK